MSNTTNTTANELASLEAKKETLSLFLQFLRDEITQAEYTERTQSLNSVDF